jgi:hypothetical protein
LSGVLQQVFTGLREQNLFAHPVKKPTAQIAFERLHRMAHSGLREAEFSRCDRETAAPRQSDESA